MNTEQKNYIELVGKVAKSDMKNSGVPASLTTAQAILEGNWGKSELAKNGNALFGIKATKAWKGKVVKKKTVEYKSGKAVEEYAEFRAYDTWEESIRDHGEFLKKNRRYAKVIGETDYKKACKAIQEAGYASDPGYADKLIDLIEDYELTKYEETDTDTSKATEEKKYYRVQAGAFRNVLNAEKMLKEVKTAGYKGAFIRKINGLYKVQAGAYNNRKNAEKAAEKLQATGVKCFITNT